MTTTATAIATATTAADAAAAADPYSFMPMYLDAHHVHPRKSGMLSTPRNDTEVADMKLSTFIDHITRKGSNKDTNAENIWAEMLQRSNISSADTQRWRKQQHWDSKKEFYDQNRESKYLSIFQAMASSPTIRFHPNDCRINNIIHKKSNVIYWQDQSNFDP